MSITWEEEHYAGDKTGDCRPYINSNAWETGDEIPFVQFSLSGEGLDSGSCKAVLNEVEYTCHLTAMGGGIWKLLFRYDENPGWGGYNAGETANLKAKVVTDVTTHYSDEATWDVLGKATNPIPGDTAVDVNVNESSLTFDHPYHKDTDYPFYGRLFNPEGVSIVYSYTPAGTFDISAQTPLDTETTYEWRMDTITDAGNIIGDRWEFTTGAGEPAKPENPDPADGSGPGVDFSDFELSWDDGGGADTFDVYIGTTGDLTQVSSAQAGTTYTTTLSEIETVIGSSPINQSIYWRVDATNTNGTTTGDEWNFDARPAKATLVAPTNAASDITLDQVLEWS